MAQAVLKECFDMAKVCGIRPAKVQGHNVEKILGYRGPFTKWLSYMIIPLAMKKHRDIISGMYCDLAAGRLCEIDFINGAALAYAKKKGADGPLNSIICNGVHEIERGRAHYFAEKSRTFQKSCVKLPECGVRRILLHLSRAGGIIYKNLLRAAEKISAAVLRHSICAG